MKNYMRFLLMFLLASWGAACAPEATRHIRVMDNPHFRVSRGPEVLADDLHHPAAPRHVSGDVIFAEGGRGTINRLRRGRVRPLIEGFGVDDYVGYDLGVLGIEVLPEQERWLVASAEGEGRLYMFDARELPSSVQAAQEIEFDDSTPLNPFDLLVIGAGPTLVASGGTSKVYQAPFAVSDPPPLRPVLEVATGIAGLARDPSSGRVYAAVIGSGQGDGEIIRWDPAAEVIEPETIADGFDNLVDVLVTTDGLLLALEFGPFGSNHAGKLLVVDDGGHILPLVTGLNAPSGFHLDESRRLLITTFGEPGRSDGTLLSFTLESR